MLRDHRALVVTFADKAGVRDYVARRVGQGYLPHAHAIVDDPAALPELPESFVIKPTHGSGAAIIVAPTAPADARLPPVSRGWAYAHIRPAVADRAQIVAIAANWLTRLYGQGPNAEWVYGQVPRRILVEELLTRADGCIPEDYKFFVFHGRCAYIEVDAGRFGSRTQDFFTADWQHLPLSGGLPWAQPEPARPRTLDEMIEVAEKLGTETDFVRVDLYEVEGRVVFGELTNFPAGGNSPFEPESFNAEFGRRWTVPRRYR